MVQLLNYGNVLFWIGLSIAVFLAGCDFFCNNLDVTLAKYKVYQFPKYPRLQKICRTLFFALQFLAPFAKVGINWSELFYSLEDHIICTIIILLIYDVVCYAFVIVCLWCLSGLIKFAKWLWYVIINLINGQFSCL